MNEEWKPVIVELEKLAQASGAELPAAFEKLLSDKPGGRAKADVWLRQATLLRTLTGFLEAANKRLDKKVTRRLSSMRDESDGGADE